MNSYFRDYHVVFSEENNNLLKLLSLEICLGERKILNFHECF